MKKGKILLALLGVCAFALAACGKGKTEEPAPVNAAQVRERREALIAEEREAVQSVPEAREPEEEETFVCYYTEKGGKWHVRENCQYLKNSKEILSGSYESALAAGKVTPCSACASAYTGE